MWCSRFNVGGFKPGQTMTNSQIFRSVANFGLSAFSFDLKQQQPPIHSNNSENIGQQTQQSSSTLQQQTPLLPSESMRELPRNLHIVVYVDDEVIELLPKLYPPKNQLPHSSLLASEEKEKENEKATKTIPSMKQQVSNDFRLVYHPFYLPLAISHTLQAGIFGGMISYSPHHNAWFTASGLQSIGMKQTQMSGVNNINSDHDETTTKISVLLPSEMLLQHLCGINENVEDFLDLPNLDWGNPIHLEISLSSLVGPITTPFRFGGLVNPEILEAGK